MRQLQKKFRLVCTYNNVNDFNIWAEYRIIDNDLPEPPEKMEFDDLDGTKSINEIWQESIGLVKTEENI